MSRLSTTIDRRSGRRGRRAVSIVEALLASTVLAIISAAAVLPFTAGIQHTQEAAKLEEAVALGQALMEEILARPFVGPDGAVYNPGPGPGETSKPLYDEIDDFDGYSESVGGLKDFQNQPVTDPEAQEFRREASVQYVTFPNQQASDANGFVRIEVRVYYGNSPIVTLTRIASRED